jgi:hypothetical protein
MEKMGATRLVPPSPSWPTKATNASPSVLIHSRSRQKTSTWNTLLSCPDYRARLSNSDPASVIADHRLIPRRQTLVSHLELLLPRLSQHCFSIGRMTGRPLRGDRSTNRNRLRKTTQPGATRVINKAAPNASTLVCPVFPNAVHPTIFAESRGEHQRDDHSMHPMSAASSGRPALI